MMRSLWFVVLAGCFSTPARPTGDGGATGGDATDGRLHDASPSLANFMFVTANRFNGTSLVAPGAADDICRDQATAAALPEPQSFVAWYSDSAQARDAITLLGSSSGWVRPDGKPFAHTIDDIVAGRLLYPPRLDAGGNEAFVDQEFVATGTSEDGGAATQCPSGGGGTVTMGVNDASAPQWTNLANGSCSDVFKLYCFGTGKQADVTPAVPTDALLAFVSQPTEFSSIENLDGQCMQDAAAAGLSGTFVALVATVQKPPSARVANPSQKSWFRVDGVRVTGPGVTEFEAPLDVDATGAHQNGGVFFGSSGPSVAASSADNCGDWANTSQSTRPGHSIRSSQAAFYGLGLYQCAAMMRVYCFQSES